MCQKYKEEKQKALYSIGLVGIRNITKLIVGGVSPFNIADQVELPPFSLKNIRAVVANNIYKARFVETFFDEANVPEPGEVSITAYDLPEGSLDMKRVLMDFHRYITQIGMNSFYQEKKTYEKTGKFLLTAWLYQFVRSGQGELRHEVPCKRASDKREPFRIITSYLVSRPTGNGNTVAD